MSVTGNKGKFSERLKRIFLFRRKKEDDNIEIEDSNKIYINFLKVVAAIPGLVYGNVVDDSKKEKQTIIDASLETANIKKINSINVKINTNNKLVKEKNRKRISEINVSEIKRCQDLFYKSKGIDLTNNPQSKKDDLQVNQNVNTNERVKELEKSIINLIKKDLIKIVNEMEILQTELYILSEVNGESKVLKDCQKELDQVKSILCKIDKLKEQYDFLKDNYDFEYLLEIDNNDIVDKIIELRDTFGNNELKALSEDYKLLDVYKYLYLKIDDLKDKTAEFEEKKQEEEAKLKDRDIDFEKLKNDVYNVEYTNRSYESFVRSQNDLLREIDNNVAKINSYELVNYRLKGFGELFRNSFKYFGLLMVSPLKGIIPSIATETLVTGNLIKNLYKSLKWEEERHTVYEAMDYSNMISNAINDLESTNRIVDMTLDDIVHLKMEYNEKFKKYQGDFLEYQDIMHKIDDMENKILGNKIKIEMMRKRALEQQKVNVKTLKLVKDLNNREAN